MTRDATPSVDGIVHSGGYQSGKGLSNDTAGTPMRHVGRRTTLSRRTMAANCVTYILYKT